MLGFFSLKEYFSSINLHICGFLNFSKSHTFLACLLNKYTTIYSPLKSMETFALTSASFMSAQTYLVCLGGFLRILGKSTEKWWERFWTVFFFFFHPTSIKWLSSQSAANYDIHKAISIQKSFRTPENVSKNTHETAHCIKRLGELKPTCRLPVAD